MRVHHVALRTHDLERLRTFYADVLGLKERARHHHPDGRTRSIWLEAGEVVVMLETAEAGEPIPAPFGMDLVAFAIRHEERAQMRARFDAARLPIEGETAYTIYVRDPDGRRVGVSSYDFG